MKHPVYWNIFYKYPPVCRPTRTAPEHFLPTDFLLDITNIYVFTQNVFGNKLVNRMHSTCPKCTSNSRFTPRVYRKRRSLRVYFYLVVVFFSLFFSSKPILFICPFVIPLRVYTITLIDCYTFMKTHYSYSSYVIYRKQQLFPLRENCVVLFFFLSTSRAAHRVINTSGWIRMHFIWISTNTNL